jgi:hypothetical protein
MRCLISAVLFLSLAAVSFGQGQGHQGQFWSPGGFGSILYPATGHAPQTPPGGITGPYFGPRAFGNSSGFAAHPQHGGGAVIVPYPIYYGGYYGYDPSAYGPANGYADQGSVPNSNAVPSVVINQNFVPQQANPVVRDYTSDQSSDQQQSGLKLYQAPPSHPYADAAQAQAARAANSDQPTLYLIAFRDHSVVQALGYWMEGSTLHYVSVEHTLNQASIDLIDRDLSQRLNDERGVEFRLPAAR